MLEVQKRFPACFLSYIHHIHIAGTLYSLGYGKITIPISVMASDFMTAYLKLSLTVKAFIAGNTAAFYPGRHGKGLGNRSRLVCIIDTEIFPQGV